MNMFDRNGQMNASSLKDAIQTLAKYAMILDDNQPSNLGMAGQVSLTEERQDDLISRAISTQEGKIALAQAMANPIN